MPLVPSALPIGGCGFQDAGVTDDLHEFFVEHEGTSYSYTYGATLELILPAIAGNCLRLRRRCK